MYKKSKVKQFAWSEKHKCNIVLLYRKDGTQFAVRDYRMGQSYTIDEYHDFPECEKIEDFVLKSGESIEQFTNTATKGTTTKLSVDNDGKCAIVSGLNNLSPEGMMNVAGNALILKALAPTCSIDECVKSVVNLAIKLKDDLE